MRGDLDIRLLRNFVAVAEELHFSRAAQRLFIAQQALSRDIRRLEERAGTALFVRSTRRVELTEAGHRLLDRARELIALHDETVQALRDESRPVTVDVVGSELTPALVLAEARQRAPDVEFFARYHTGIASVPLLLSGELDVTFGRSPDLPSQLNRHVVRLEPLAVLVPHRHPLADQEEIPLRSMSGPDRPCIHSGDQVTPGWEDAMHQLLESDQIEPDQFHPQVQGQDELAHHVRERNAPILTVASQPSVPGAVLRPVVDPVPYFPWAMIWRPEVDPPAIQALLEAITTLSEANNWLAAPRQAWLPQPESDARR